MTALLLLLLLSTAQASPPPVPWYCDDEGLAGELAVALDTFWKEGPVEIRVGLPRDGTSIHYEGGSLVLRDGGRSLQRPAPRDPATLVLLARSWSRELEHIQAEDWFPSLDLPRPPPPPPPAQPPPPPVPRPLGYAWDLGLGIRDSATEPATLEGTRLVGRVFAGRVGLEADLYLAGASSQRVSSLERSLLDLFADAKSSTPVHLVRDTTSLTTSVTLGPDPLKRGGGLRGGPFVLAGLEARRYAVFRAVVNPEAGEVFVEADASYGWALGPVGGAGIELWLGRVGLRVSGTERAAMPIGGDSTFSEGVRLDPTLTVDLLLSGV